MCCWQICNALTRKIIKRDLAAGNRETFDNIWVSEEFIKSFQMSQQNFSFHPHHKESCVALQID